MKFDLNVINSIKDLLDKEKLTLAVAESVTSGYLQAAFSAATMASQFFQGGITAYNAGQKCRQLNVEPIYSMKDDCVSEIVASQMAVEVNNVFLSGYGIGITGYATTVPEAGINDLFAYFAIARYQDVLMTKKITTTRTDTIEAQLDYTVQVIQAFNDLLEKR